MITIFYLFLFLFILNDLFYLSNKDRLDVFFKNKNQNQIKKIDFFYYLLRIVSIIWPFIGLLSSFSDFFLLVIFLNFIKYIIYHILSRFYDIYVKIHPILLISIYITILFYKFS